MNATAPPDRAKILARIKKCLALAGSPEPGEAAAALRAAQALMKKYGLTEEDVSFADIREATTGASGSTSLAQWENILIDCVRCSFNVQVLFRHGDVLRHLRVRRPRSGTYYWRLSRKRGWLLFIGPQNRVQVALYAFEALRRQLKRARATHRAATGHKGRSLDVFCLGWVAGVRKQLAALAAPFTLDPVIQDYIDREHGDARETAKQRSNMPRKTEMAAYLSGHEAAQDAVLHAGVGSVAASATLQEPAKQLPAAKTPCQV